MSSDTDSIQTASDEEEEEDDSGDLSHLGAAATSVKFQTVQQQSYQVAEGVLQQNIIQVQQQFGDVTVQGTRNLTIGGTQNIGKQGQCQVEEKALTEKIMKKTLSKIEDWTKGMVRTSALEKVLEKLNRGTSWVTIKGSPGEGKSTVAYMALGELHKKGRQVFQVGSPKKFSQITATCSLPVIMLDDVFGNLEFDQVKWLLWEEVLHDVIDPKEHKSHEEQSKKSVTVILVGREYVLNAASCNMGRMANFFTQDEHVVFMSNTVEREIQEKHAIWKAVSESSGIELDQKTIDEICRIKVPHGFPHVCRLFVTLRKKSPKITIEEFFETPLEFLNQTVVKFMRNKQKLIVFKELIKSDGIVSVRELGKLDSGSETIQTAYDLVGSYLRKEDDCFMFDHPSIYDSVAFNICELYPLFVIDNCNLSFIHERVRIQPSCDTQHDPPIRESGLVVYIPRSYVGDLAKRFTVEIAKLNLLQVFSHKEFRDEHFIKEVMSMSQPLTELITLADCKSGENILSLLASNKSPQLLKYVHNQIGRQLKEDEKYTVLYGVCKYSASDVLTYLTQICDTLDINVRYGDMKQTPLMMAAETRDGQFVHDILSLNPDVNARDSNSTTAFHYLCKNGLVSAATQVIDRVTDIDREDMFALSPLSYACWSNQIEVVKLLLDRGVRVYGWTVWEACKYGSLNIVSLLFERGATVNMTSYHGYTPLHAACWTGNMKVIKYLIDEGASVNIQDDCNLRSPLYEACFYNKSQAVQYLLDHGADMESRNRRGYTSLHAAAERGSQECVDDLLKAGADVNVKSEDGFAPLFAAAESGSQECVDMLLKAGANVNVQSTYSSTPLHTAAECGCKECVDVLLIAGADVNVQSNGGYTPLHRAAGSGSKECVEVLLKAGADVNVQRAYGYSPLHSAAERGYKECVDVLLKAGADVNVQSTYGYTPLQAAAEWGYKECVDVFLKAGADMNVQSEDGYTPLHTAAETGSKECIYLLVKAGADVNVQDKDGNTPLYKAVERGTKECADVFLEAGADVNVQGKDGNTPLYKAVERGSKECVEVLLKAGADVNVHCEDGNTPLHTTVQSGSKECIDVLLKAGADVNAQNENGLTSLHTAVYPKLDFKSDITLPDIYVCQTLIRHRSDINKQDTEGNTPLHLLCRVDSDTAIFIDSDYDTEKDTCWPYQHASFYEDLFRTLLTLLIDHGADVNIHNNRGEQALRGWLKSLVRRNQDLRKVKKTSKLCTLC